MIEKTTPVEWLSDQICDKIDHDINKKLGVDFMWFMELIEQAKQMEATVSKMETIKLLDGVTRLEVIDKDGRQYVVWNTSIKLSFQDDNRTLKIFVNN